MYGYLYGYAYAEIKTTPPQKKMRVARPTVTTRDSQRGLLAITM